MDLYADLCAVLQHAKFYAPLLFAIVVSVVLGLVSHLFIYKVLVKHDRAHHGFVNTFSGHMRGPLYIILPLCYLLITISILDFSAVAYIIGLTIKTLLIIALSWSIIRLMDYVDIWLLTKYPADSMQAVRAEVMTKMRLIKNVLRVVIFLLATALILLSFDGVRQIGKGILLSATAIGALVALGAQKLLSNIISGFQLAFTKPIKIGDMVVIEGQFGAIEEVTLTHVTVCLWDLRRLILPLTYLIDKPFENWSSSDSNLLGTVFFYTDYTADVDQLRVALSALLDRTPLWDKAVGKLEVTEISEKTMQLRALVSARNADDLWGLRCYIREGIIKFIHVQAPHGLPIVRTQQPYDGNS